MSAYGQEDSKEESTNEAQHVFVQFGGLDHSGDAKVLLGDAVSANAASAAATRGIFHLALTYHFPSLKKEENCLSFLQKISKT